MPGFSRGELTKAKLREVEGGREELSFQFNPSELKVSKSAQWSRAPVRSAERASEPEFVGVQPATVSIDAFFDEWESAAGDVSKPINTLMKWTLPTEESLKQYKPRPPTLAFEWGLNSTLEGFQGFLRQVNATYVMFLPNGTPVRATASIQLEEVPT